MKKLIPILISIYLLLFINFAEGQPAYTFIEDTLSVESNDAKVEVIATGKIKNEADRPVTIVWERSLNQYPSDWMGTKICDINKCYGMSVNSRTFELSANETGDLKVYFVNDQKVGTAHVKVKIYQSNDSAGTSDFMHFFAKQPTSTSSQSIKVAATSSIQIYPNPVEDYLMVKNPDNQRIRKIAVYNILGSKVKTYRAEPGAIINRINMQNLDKGVYMVRVLGPNNRMLKSKSVSKSR